MILGANTIIKDKHETELNIIGWSGIRTTSTALDTAPSVISRYRCPNQYQPYSLPSSPVPHLKGISYQRVGSHSFVLSLSLSLCLSCLHLHMSLSFSARYSLFSWMPQLFILCSLSTKFTVIFVLLQYFFHHSFQVSNSNFL